MQIKKIKDEAQVIALLSKGAQYKTISEITGVNLRTVEACINRLKDKYKALNTTHLVAIALRDKIIK